MKRKNHQPTSGTRRGFTLIEILTVIAIIGILAALSIPAIGIAVRRAKQAAIRLEIDGISQALEAYRLDYGAYPPDFVNWPIVERHYRKAFPNIDQSELLLLQRLTDVNSANDTNFSIAIGAHNPVAMNRAEALVWALGGFSADKKRPFTGPGGPLTKIGEISTTNPISDIYQINSEREIGPFTFKSEQLTIYGTGDGQAEVDPGATLSVNNRYLSTDDAGTVADPHDLFPTFTNSSAGNTPFVYFDSRTYDYQVPAVPAIAASGEFNGYAGTGGALRPFFTDRAKPKTTTTAYPTRSASLKAWEFANANTFQVVSAGIDGSFGLLERDDIDGDNIDDPVYWQYPTGQLIAGIFGGTATNPNSLLVPSVSKFQENAVNGNTENPVLDNITNFSTSTLESDLP